MQVFAHHLYEHKKGLRNLILHTTKAEYKDEIISRLNKNNISFLIQHVGNDKINVFFGSKECVEVVNSFINKSLTDLTDEEDFILGIMLGYDRLLQCKRYLKRKARKDLKIAS